ncbi:t124 [Tupaiid betaherpesvirus 1]|uniref:T124 n=1 Tax=Tupaiid herpesvirus 1 (strain 1) TaxID=10397 RepID=Q91TH2_TUHV1|nr:t124 [Tupaiid betaherpesvirus 1]AAK57175.1 t124 [Tupaiid betaherpesvirus 1]
MSTPSVQKKENLTETTTYASSGTWAAQVANNRSTNATRSVRNTPPRVFWFEPMSTVLAIVFMFLVVMMVMFCHVMNMNHQLKRFDPHRPEEIPMHSMEYSDFSEIDLGPPVDSRVRADQQPTIRRDWLEVPTTSRGGRMSASN